MRQCAYRCVLLPGLPVRKGVVCKWIL